MTDKNKIVMKCKAEKQTHNNILGTMINQELIKKYCWIHQSINKDGFSLVYSNQGMNLKQYAYLENTINKKVINLIKKKEKINQQINNLIRENQNSLIPLTEKDVLRMKVKGYEKIKEYKKPKVREQYKKDNEKNSISLGGLFK